MIRRAVFASCLWALASGLLAQSLPVDLEGKPVDPLESSAKLSVVVFVRSDCPISNRYAPEIQRLYDKYSAKGVAFWLVYPDPAETSESIRKHMREYGYGMAALRDPRHALVRLAKAEVTPETAVFAPGGRLEYRGRIDDRYVDLGKTRPRPTVYDLEDAIDALLAGRPVAAPAARAIGCFLSDLR